VRTYPRHEVIRREGDPVAGVGCVLRGLMRCWLIDADGNDCTVETAWSGSVSLVGLGGPESEWPWNVTTLTPTTVFALSWEALEAVRRRYPLDKALMDCAAADYRRRHIWQGMLRSVRLRPRLLRILRRMADELGTETERGVLLDFPMTHGDLAHLTYVTRDEVGRVMREFTADGLVKIIGRRGLLIPDPRRLGPPIRLR
jgi:CRP/FNR family transcriptional regulator